MKKTATLCLLAGVFCLSAQSQGKYPSILWEIKKTPSSKPSYLFGTYHISDKGVFKLGDSIFHALKKVDMVATEVNDNTWQENTAMFDSMKNAYQFYNSYFYGSFIDEGTLRKTNTIQKLPIFISFQPNTINYFLYRNTDAGEGFEEEAFLDRFISSAGYKYGKKIAGLENVIESEIKQIEGEKDEKLLDKEENKELPDGLSESEVNDMIFDGYKNNSLDMMDSLNKYNFASDAYYKKFVTARNYDQADSLDYYIHQGLSVFAAVGSAHLPGREGVIEIMRKKGYKVRPVKLKGHDKAEVDAIKKKYIPVVLKPQTLDGGLSFRAPGRLQLHLTNSLIRAYSYVDMANGAYYMVSRVYNNSFFFGKNEAGVLEAIDSLLYENVRGDITEKNKITFNGYPALDVTSQLKNKDFERYRFVVTPYEVLKIKAGGKNNYATMPVIDSFFNSFSIVQESVVPPDAGLSISANNNNWHTWYSEYFSEATSKIRFSNYDRNKKIMNGIFKISIAENNLKPDADYYKMAAESFTSSFALKKEENKNLDLSKITGPQTGFYKMETGGTLAAKTFIRHPFMYVIFSASHSEKPDTSWMNNVTVSDVNSPSSYSFVDSLKAFSCKLPCKMNFDSKWKAASERKTEKPDPDKKMNRNEALFYNNDDVYSNGKWDLYSFQHPKSLDMIWGGTLSLDSSHYYPDAASFWKGFVPKPYNREYYTKESLSNSAMDMYNPDGDDDFENGYYLSRQTEYIINLKYDTTDKVRQQVSYVKADSLSNKGVYTTTILYQDKVYDFQTIVAAPEYKLPQFFKNFIESFKPVNTNAAYNIYAKKLDKLLDRYKKAEMPVKPDIAEQLNKFSFNISNLPEIEKAIAGLKEQKPENNILRRKLVEAVCESDKNEQDWPVISNWLKKIYQDKSELLTIRFFAATKILDKHDERDAAWVMDNIRNNVDFRSSAVRRQLTEYFTKVKNKQNLKSQLSVSNFGSGATIYFQALTLYDSGYFNNNEMKAAFAEINKLVADEKSGLQLQAEGELFKYPEKAEKKTMSDLKYDDNFQFYSAMFSMFYSALPDDSFFADAYKKILKDGTPKDKLELLKTFAKQKTAPAEWTKALLESLAAEKAMYFEIFKTFLFYKKENLLPEVYKNRVDIAHSYLKQKDSYYNNPDTIYFFGSKASPFVKGETCYFFKYRNEKELNEQIAYVILPENLSVILTKKGVKHKFTKEQVGEGESFVTVSDKLMRRQYIDKLYGEGESEFYLEEKDEKSLDIEE